MSSEDLRTELAVLRNDLKHILAAIEAIRQEIHSWRVDHETRLRRLEDRVTRLEGRDEHVDDLTYEYRKLRIGIIVAVIGTLLAALLNFLL